MKQATHSEREKFVALMIRNCPTATASTCQRLMRLGATYGRLVRSHDRTEFQTIKMGIMAIKITRLARSLGMVAGFGPPFVFEYSVFLAKGEINLGIPTS